MRSDKLRAERGREIVAAALDEDQIEIGKARDQPRDRLEIDRSILADRGMRTAAGFHADDALGGERFVAHQELRIFLGVDVVGDDREVVASAQRAAQRAT